jgi:hypothetical protein
VDDDDDDENLLQGKGWSSNRPKLNFITTSERRLKTENNQVIWRNSYVLYVLFMY